MRVLCCLISLNNVQDPEFCRRVRLKTRSFTAATWCEYITSFIFTGVQEKHENDGKKGKN